MTELDSDLDALIVGAGFAGLYQLHRLRELGMRAQVVEKASGVGGTWFHNRYPGARCDVESIAYSFSFSRELESEWTWSERFAAQPEILRYIEHVADRFDLRRDVVLDTAVTSAVYDEASHAWDVVADGGATVRARYLILATGCLSVVKSPEVPGAAEFAGPIYHTGNWPHEGVDFTGQRVGVIGTGSSGIQAIPEIARQAADLTVFQRTPSFSLPARNRPLGEAEVAEVKATYPQYREAQRQSAFGTPGVRPTRRAFEATEEEREETYRAGWATGSIRGLLGAYTDIVVNPEANETAAEFIRGRIRDIVEDPEVAETLSPRTVPFGTKRPCLDTGYYATYNRTNVHLVDLMKTPLAEITSTGLRTTADDYAFDSIVFATGFDAMTGAILAMDIRGRDGVSLRDKWSEGPRSYLGLSVAGFPNLFTITGPSSPSVLSNMVLSIEQHVDWITDCIAHVREQGYSEVEATEDAEDGWVTKVAEIANGTLYPRANSWYVGANVPGKPRVFMAFIGGVDVYRRICDEIAANGYEGYAMSTELAVH